LKKPVREFSRWEHRCRRNQREDIFPFAKAQTWSAYSPAQIKLVRDDDNVVAVLRGEPAQGFEKIHWAPISRWQRRLVEKQEERRLRECAGENHALLASPPRFFHPAVGEFGGADWASALLAMRMSSSDSKRSPPP